MPQITIHSGHNLELRSHPQRTPDVHSAIVRAAGHHDVIVHDLAPLLSQLWFV